MRGAEIRKTRPVVVSSAEALNRVRRTVVVVPLSTGAAPRPSLVVATPSVGAASVAVCDQVRALDLGRLVGRAGRLSAADLRAVAAGLRGGVGLVGRVAVAGAREGSSGPARRPPREPPDGEGEQPSADRSAASIAPKAVRLATRHT